MKKFNLLATIMLSLFLLSSCCAIKNTSRPKDTITREVAKDLNNRYNRLRSEIISNSPSMNGREDSNATWYSIEVLENYINYAKSEAKKNNYAISGIRFYMGVYPENYEVREKAGLTTIFLSATKNRYGTQKEGLKMNLKSDSQKSSAAILEENLDALEVSPLNFGGMGHPPRIEYPINQ
jgi:hypothetical protein